MRRAGQAKKLTEAARLLARGEGLEVVQGGEQAPEAPAVDEQLLADAEAMGVDPQSLVDSGIARAEAEPWPFLLYESNVETFDAWMGLQSQWKLVAPPMGEPVHVGLDYAGALADLRALGWKGARLRDLWIDVKAMEQAYLGAKREARGTGGGKQGGRVAGGSGQ